MGKSAPSAPAAPDPAATSAAQAQANMGTARVQQRLGMIDQSNPWYSVTYTDKGDRTKNADGTPMASRAASPQQPAQGATSPAYPQDPNSNGGAGNSVDPNPGNGPGSANAASGAEGYGEGGGSGSGGNGPGSGNSTGAGAYGDRPMKAAGDPVQGRSTSASTRQGDYVGRLNWDDNGNPTVPGQPQQQAQAQQPAATSRTGAYDPNDPMAGEQAYFNQDRWQQTVTLNPEDQKNLDLSRQITGQIGGMTKEQLGRISGALGAKVDMSNLPEMVSSIGEGNAPKVGDIQRSVDFSGAPALQSSIGDVGSASGMDPNTGRAATTFADAGGPQRTLGPQDWSADRQRSEDAVYSRAASRLDPRFASEQRALEQRLADQGIPVGSEAYSRAMDDFGRSKTDAYAAATNDAVAAGGAEQSRIAGLDMNRFALENDAQNTEFGQNLTRAQFGNAGQQQNFDQAATRTQIGNQAQQQNFDQAMGRAGLNNASRQQAVDELMRSGQFANEAEAQQFAEEMGLFEATGNRALANANLQNTARQNTINEREYVRKQPITDLAGLMAAVGNQ